MLKKLRLKRFKNFQKVKVCQDPLLGGVNEALKWERIEEIIDQYRGMFNLFLLCVDRDGKVGRKATLDDIMLIFSTTLVQRGAKAPTTNRLQSS